MARGNARYSMPGGQRQWDLLKAVSQPSVYELMMQVYNVGMELSAATFFNTGKMGTAVNSDAANSRRMFLLLHSMSKAMIWAIVGGVVAYNTLEKGVQWYERPSRHDASGAGVYVVGLARKGRNGKFLTATEMLKLIKGITGYIQGAEIHRGGRGARPTSDQKLLDWVQEVDASYHTEWDSVKQGPKFISADKDVRSMKCLRRGFEERCEHTDAAERDLPQHQSPQYVGCSTRLQDRMKVYDSPKTLERVNSAMGFVLSLCCALGFELDMVPRVAIRIWEANTLAAAEHLVAILARSMIFQTGFNLTATGGQPGGEQGFKISPMGLFAATTVVMQDYPWMSSNLDATLSVMQRRSDMVEGYKGLLEDVKTLEDLLSRNKRLQDELDSLQVSKVSKANRRLKEVDYRVGRAVRAHGNLTKAMACLELYEESQRANQID